MDYKPTTNRLGDSRIIKFAVIGIAAIIIVQIAAYGIGVWVTRLLSVAEENRITALQRVAEILFGIPGSAGIAGIVTAVIARYGLREATGNIGEGIKGK